MANIPSMIDWLAPVTYTTPVADQWYYTASLAAGSLLVPYTPNYQGPDTLQPDTYQEYSVNFFGDLTQDPASYTSAINSVNPQAIPATTLEYKQKSFGGANGADVGEYFASENANGTYTYYVSVVNTSTSPPTVYTNSAAAITVTPVAKTGPGNATAQLAPMALGTSQNTELFEVEGSTSAGTTTGTFEIIGTSDNVIASGTGFSFSDGKAHVFLIGPSYLPSNPNVFAEAVEVWNPSTGLADVQISGISATGTVRLGFTVATELQSITNMDFSYEADGPNGPGESTPDNIGVVDGSNAGGRGFFLFQSR